MNTNATPDPRPEPLFSLDLKDNGGLFAPVSSEEAHAWIQHELSFWSWLNNSHPGGNHDQGIRLAIGQLSQAQQTINQARQYRDSNPQHYQGQFANVRSQLEDVFHQRQLPHSSTPRAKYIEDYRKKVGVRPAHFFASVFVPPQHGYQFQPQELADWRGLIEGLIACYDLASAPAKGRKQAAAQSFEQLRVKAETLLGDKTTIYDDLHRDYSELAESIKSTETQQKSDFDGAQTKRDSDFETLVSEHKQEMENLRRTFREEIAMKAPVTYWEDKRKEHVRLGRIAGGLSFAGIAAAAGGLVWLIHDLLRSSSPGVAPEAWRVATLVLIGLFAVWGLRLVVRIFLSHLHLATDAAERVVMARTYLSLLEGDRLTSKEDRQLILQALFRPTSDGIVKDEGIPPSALEFLTRQSKG